MNIIILKDDNNIIVIIIFVYRQVYAYADVQTANSIIGTDR